MGVESNGQLLAAPGGPGDLPDPAARRPAGLPGVALVVAGRLWVLPYLLAVRTLDPHREAFVAARYGKGRTVPPGVVRDAAFRLLNAGYELTGEEALALVDAADNEDLKQSVGLALLGPGVGCDDYSGWFRGAFLANGLDVRAIPPEDVAATLKHLVMTDRVAPLDHWDRHAENERAKRDLWKTLGGHG